MARDNRNNQFSIAGLLFVTVGLALFCAAVPYLYGMSAISPPWSVFAAIIVMIGWAMIPLHEGSARAWWIGFVIAGTLYLAIVACNEARLAEILNTMARKTKIIRRIQETAMSFGEVPVAFAIVIVLFLLFLGCGAIGGWIAKRFYNGHVDRQSTPRNNVPNNRSALP